MLAQATAEEAVRISGASAWQSRAALWELLALSFAYPDRTLCRSVASGEWADAASELLGMIGSPVQDAGLCNGPSHGAEDAESLLHALRVEHTRLFVGSPTPAVSPYESVWRARDEGIEPLLLVNPHAAEAERCCNRFGLGKPKGANLPLDCIDAECELLEHMALGAFRALGGDAGALPQGAWAEGYGGFLREHAGCWMPRFAEEVAAQAEEPFYQRAAKVLQVALAHELAAAASPDR